ncbi:hypothetical protein EGW08_006792 [Elysia chlorotica]|uniref:Uncharacterized protein n=1 Tax=Elysia chlorotica TaxID=188477 RepID=A0A3S0ZXF7_ELYCH|nr:hypothetical protein EGW08_006792 [Elysia chlorotica]
MAGQGRLLESPTNVHSHISQKLTEDGLNPESTDLEKLLFLWKLHQNLEEDLRQAKETEAKLKEAQSEEMKEVENYVEHIRHLSDERENLILELEEENKALKEKVSQAGQAESDGDTQAEITEMLTQQGLAEISDATQSEQIAYLLVERARLLDELEEHNSNNSNSNNNSTTASPHNTDGRSSETELKQILEQERGDFEEELKEQRESAKMMREQLKQEHEEEINALMEENSKLEDDLQKAEMMVSQLKAELSGLTDGEETDSGLNRSIRAGSSEEELQKLAEERNQINREREDLEKDLADLDKDRETVEREKQMLKKEKDELSEKTSALDKERSNMKKEKVKLEKEQQELDEQKEELVHIKETLAKDRSSLNKQIQDLENRRADLEEEQNVFYKEKQEWEKENKESPRAQTLRNGSPVRSSNDMALRKIIEEKTKIEGELVQMRTQLRSVQKEKDSHDEVASVDSLTKEKKELLEKTDSLNTELKTMRADAMKSSTLQDIVDILSNDKKQLAESLEALKSKHEQVNHEKNELANQNEKLTKQEQELTNQLQALKEDFEKLAKEKDHLTGENHELASVTKKQEEVEALLRADLEEMGKAKEQFVNQTETLGKENKDLVNKLERTREEMEAVKLSLQELARQEIVIEHLKGQNQHLQTQANSSQNELEKSKERETMLITTQQSLQKSHDDVEKRYAAEIDDLKLKLELTLQELARSKQQAEDLARDKTGLAETLTKTEALLHESAEVKDILEEEKRQKNALKLEINKLGLQLAEQTLLADKFEGERKQRLELEAQVSSLRDVEETIKVISRELEKEKKMRQSLEENVEDLERTASARVSKEELTSAHDNLNRQRQKCYDLEAEVKELEHKFKDAQISAESATEQLTNEKTLRLSLEANVKELQVALTQQGSAEELSRLREELSKERAALRDLEESREDVQLLCGELEKERSLRAELTRKVTGETSASPRTLSSSTLTATLDELERERRGRAEGDLRIQELEQMLDDNRVDSDNLRHSMSSKMMSLEKRVQALQDDLFSAQDELQAFQDRYDDVRVCYTLLKLRSKAFLLDFIYNHHFLFQLYNKDLSISNRDLETSLISTTTKLQETLNELNLVKSQLCQNQQELASSRVDIGNSRQEVDLLKQSLEMATKHLDESEDELQTFKNELVHTQESLEVTRAQLKERQSKLDAVVAERDEIQRELDTMFDEQQMRVTPRPLDPSLYGSDERQEHVDRISTLETLSRQLELDNREMARKLSDTMAKCESLEDQIERTKMRSSDKYHHSSRYTEQLEHDMDSANKHIRQLREDLQHAQTKNFKLEADNLGLSAKYESTISRLEQDIKDLKHRHRQELDSLSERMEASSSEARDMRSQKRDVDQELSRLRQEVSRLKSDKEQLDNHLQAESKMKLDLQNRNSVMDNEMTKVWSQVRSLMEKNADLESSNRNQTQESTMKETKLRQIEASLNQKEATYEASTKALVLRAETAENKCKSLQQELEEVTRKLMQVESQLTQADTGRIQLEDSRDKLIAIRNQLEGEKLQRTLLDQTVAELKHQVSLLKQRESKVTTENKELQHTILDLESRLNELKDTASKVKFDTQPHHKMTDVGTRSLMDQIARLQREVKDLQFELYSVSERRDVDVKKYEERKHRTKAKLSKAREFYTTERSKYMDHMKHLDEDLRLTRATLTKELEWREKMDDNYKTLMREKRDLISQLSEAGEKLRDRSRALSMAQVRVQYLEEETAGLQARLQNVLQQKQGLDKMLRDHGRREKFRVTSPSTEQPTSGLGNSLDSRWGSCDRLDSLNQSHQSHLWAGGMRAAGSSLGIGVSSLRGGGTVGEGEQAQYDDDDEMNVCGRSGDRLSLSQAMRTSSQGSMQNDSRDGGGGGGGSKNNHKLSDGDAGIVIIPQEHDDYTLYTEIDDIRQHDDQYYDEDDFHA